MKIPKIVKKEDKPKSFRLSLVIAFLSVLFVGVIGEVYILYINKPYKANYDSIVSTHKLVVGVLYATSRNAAMEDAVQDYVLTGNTEYKTIYNSNKPAIRASDLHGITLTSEEQSTYSQLTSSDAELSVLRQQIITLIDQKQMKQASALIQGSQYESLKTYVASSYNAFDQQTDAYVSSLVSQNDKVNKKVTVASYILPSFELVMSVALAWTLATVGRNRILELERAAERIGKGELDVRVPVRGQDEIGRVAIAFNKLAVTLQDLGPQSGLRLQEITEDIGEKLPEKPVMPDISKEMELFDK